MSCGAKGPFQCYNNTLVDVYMYNTVNLSSAILHTLLISTQEHTLLPFY